VLAPLAQIPAQVKKDERLTRIIGQIQLKKPKIALQLGPALRGVLVAGVMYDNVSPANLAAAAANRPENLLVHTVFPAGGREIAEQADVVHSRAFHPCRCPADTDTSSNSRNWPTADRKESGELAPVGVIDTVIRIEPEIVIAGRMAETFISCGCEIIHPTESQTTLAPACLAMLRVESVDPVSTTIHLVHEVGQ